MNHLIDFFIEAYYSTPAMYILLEFIAFVFGIVSVVYAKRSHIWVYPSGLVATVISVFLLYKAGFFGDMMMNFYYSVMSIYGWWNWARKKDDVPILAISRTTVNEKTVGVFMFILTMLVTYGIYSFYDYELATTNYIDILTSGIFFTAMWYMANKKIENWILWIIADIITVPLYAYRGLGMLSLQYLIFTILAIQGYLQWKKHLSNSKQIV